jgi:O-antigen/teichoic acid export membrane protein
MKLSRNIFHLFIWQGSTFLVPLIVTPYLARVLGIHAYGVYGLTIGVTAYAMLIADWGFNLSATQKIARAGTDAALLRRLFWGTLLAKLMLMVASLTGLATIILFIPQFRAIWQPLAAASSSVLATALTANWFLQGQQRMGSFAAASLIGRLLTIPLVLLFVHHPQDVVFAAGIQGATQLISAAASIIVSMRIARLGPIEIDVRFAARQIYDGWHQFASNFSVAMYTQANAVFVGLAAGQLQAGLITGSQRLQGAFLGLIQPVTMAVYPHVNRVAEEDPPRATRIMFRLLGAQFAYGCLLGAIMYGIAPYIVPLFLGPAFRPAIAVVQVLALLPPLAALTNSLGTNMLLPLSLKAPYTASLVAAGFVNVGLLLLVAGRYGAYGGAWCAVVTETFLMVAMSSALYFNRSYFQRMRRGERPWQSVAK